MPDTENTASGQPFRVELPTSGRLVRSTLLAASVAGLILVAVVLPSQYGLDPTGLGSLTRTIEIGERRLPLESFVQRSDEMSVTLKPGHAAEVKLRMKKGAKATYSWTVEGGTVSFNSHGEGPGDAFKRYERGQDVGGADGVLAAKFYGHHGWFWRNPNKKPVTVTVRTDGNYADIKLID